MVYVPKTDAEKADRLKLHQAAADERAAAWVAEQVRIDAENEVRAESEADIDDQIASLNVDDKTAAEIRLRMRSLTETHIAADRRAGNFPKTRMEHEVEVAANAEINKQAADKARTEAEAKFKSDVAAKVAADAPTAPASGPFIPPMSPAPPATHV